MSDRDYIVIITVDGVAETLHTDEKEALYIFDSLTGINTVKKRFLQLHLKQGHRFIIDMESKVHVKILYKPELPGHLQDIANKSEDFL